jgi:hypothetical protein
VSFVLVGGAIGCGGGSGSTNNPNPNPGTNRSTVTGTVTDPEGSSFVGATVTIGGQTATTTQFGTYSIPDVAIPNGQTSLITTVSATANVNGITYSGSNTVEILASEPLTNNIQVAISPANQQGTISGRVLDNQGRPLQGARVFAGIPNPNDNCDFNTLSSITAYTNNNGDYSIPNLAAGTYTVTASYAGRVNQTLQNLNVTPGSNINAPFTLVSGTGGGTPIVSNFSAISITTPTTPTRAAAGNTNAVSGMEALRQWVRTRHAKRVHRTADVSKVFVGKSTSRATPAGSIIEGDLFWDYTQLDNLFGYVILRSDNSDTNFRTIALLRDPLAERFADIDGTLTPDLNYYYSVARLDTVNFPANGDEGDPSDLAVIRPLNAISLNSPAAGATTNARPLFSWTPVNRATLYQILVYDRFPTYQSNTAQNGTAPIWPADPNNPGTSLIDVSQGARNTQQYDGPALVSGRTYYWAVLASDDVGSAYTITPLQAFTVQ